MWVLTWSFLTTNKNWNTCPGHSLTWQSNYCGRYSFILTRESATRNPQGSAWCIEHCFLISSGVNNCRTIYIFLKHFLDQSCYLLIQWEKPCNIDEDDNPFDAVWQNTESKRWWVWQEYYARRAESFTQIVCPQLKTLATSRITKQGLKICCTSVSEKSIVSLLIVSISPFWYKDCLWQIGQ